MKCSLIASVVAFLIVSSHSLPMLELKPAVKLPKQGQNSKVAKSLGLTELLSAAEEAKIAQFLEMGESLTLFGPTNEAFDTIPDLYKELLVNGSIITLKEVLFFHIIKSVVYASAIKNELLVPSILEMPKKDIRFNVYGGGKVVTAQCSRIIKVNQNASNGVIHVVSRVMIPPFGTVTDVVSNPNAKEYFETLLRAVLAAKLQGVLAEPGPYTVFAPTEDAFAKIPAPKLKEILKNIPLLTKILKYHVVSGTFCSAGLTDEAKVPTLAGSVVTIHISGGKVAVNNARVEFADLPVTNGVVHVIDTVLMPPEVEI